MPYRLRGLLYRTVHIIFNSWDGDGQAGWSTLYSTIA
jgi:hypothetical protein